MPGFHTITRLKKGRTGTAIPGVIWAKPAPYNMNSLEPWSAIREMAAAIRPTSRGSRRFMPAPGPDGIGAAVAQMGVGTGLFQHAPATGAFVSLRLGEFGARALD